MIVERKSAVLPPDTESVALIEQFLAVAGNAPASAEAVSEDASALPADHRSGFVALIGRPNVGKSTLVNAFLGKKISIVSPKPQTTRYRIFGILTRPDYQMVFVDTPGIHAKPAHKLNAAMIEQSLAAIPDADALLFVVDISTPPHAEDAMIAQLLQEKGSKQPVFMVLNKNDAWPPEQLVARQAEYLALSPMHTASIITSALHSENLTGVLDLLLPELPYGPRYYPDEQITDQTERQIAAELIREALLRYTQQEVPHAAAVLIEDYQERENAVLYISATLWVERESQKPIMIGKQGERLRQIGTAARQELERFIGSRVYLDLWVKVKPKWRDHDGRLRELGLK